MPLYDLDPREKQILQTFLQKEKRNNNIGLFIMFLLIPSFVYGFYRLFQSSSNRQEVWIIPVSGSFVLLAFLTTLIVLIRRATTFQTLSVTGRQVIKGHIFYTPPSRYTAEQCRIGEYNISFLPDLKRIYLERWGDQNTWWKNMKKHLQYRFTDKKAVRKSIRWFQRHEWGSHPVTQPAVPEQQAYDPVILDAIRAYHLDQAFPETEIEVLKLSADNKPDALYLLAVRFVDIIEYSP